MHIPADGQLLSSRYIPGELFSVNQKTTEGLPDLFTRNERLVCEFKSEQMGNFTVIFVGAVVAGIETVWSGFEAPGPVQLEKLITLIKTLPLKEVMNWVALNLDLQLYFYSKKVP